MKYSINFKIWFLKIEIHMEEFYFELFSFRDIFILIKFSFKFCENQEIDTIWIFICKIIYIYLFNKFVSIN